jgi:hypothetical protein
MVSRVFLVFFNFFWRGTLDVRPVRWDRYQNKLGTFNATHKSRLSAAAHNNGKHFLREKNTEASEW